MLRLALATLFCSLTLSAVAAKTTVDLVAKEAFASDALGEPQAVRLGEKFYVTLRYDVKGDLKAAYAMAIELPYAKLRTTNVTFGQGSPGSYFLTWGPVSALLADPITIKTTLIGAPRLSEMSKANNVATFQFQPIVPAQGAEYFAPRDLTGALNVHLQWDRSPEQITTWAPHPISESSQKAMAVQIPESFEASGDQPFLLTQPWAATSYDFQESATVRASNQRINPEVLREAQFSGYDQSDKNQTWLRAEPLCELGASQLMAFASNARSQAPSNRPYDVALAVYKAVLARMAYDATPAAPSALRAYQRKRGDCGAMSSLFVAGCRLNGVPARCVTGFLEGENRWHVWAEFQIPGAGWIACDPSYAKQTVKKNTPPIYFGVIDDLNARFISSFGLEQRSGAQSVPFLQAPSVYWSAPNARLTHVQSACSLTSAQ